MDNSTPTVAPARFDQLEDMIYHYTRSQRSYHENMSLLLNQLVAPATASESAPHAAHAAPTPHPTTSSRRPPPPLRRPPPPPRARKQEKAKKKQTPS